MKHFSARIPLALVFGTWSIVSHAAVLNNGDVLHITAGFTSYDSTGNPVSVSGSYYGVDTNGNSAISNYEKILLSEGTTGLVIGAGTTPGASHSGSPTAGDTNQITAPDIFLGNTGSWYSTTPITGSTISGLNMSDWDWAWNGILSIPLGGGAWQPTNCADLGCTGYTFSNGVGRLVWDGVYGHAYTLDFASTVPTGDPSGFGDVKFYTHLEGTVQAVPVPAAVWLLGSGLLGLLGVAPRRKAS